MTLLMIGAATLAAAWFLGTPGYVTLVLPMRIMAVGIVVPVSVTAKGALAPFADRAGTAVAIYFAGQSIIIWVLGTAAVLLLGGGHRLAANRVRRDPLHPRHPDRTVARI